MDGIIIHDALYYTKGLDYILYCTCSDFQFMFIPLAILVLVGYIDPSQKRLTLTTIPYHQFTTVIARAHPG